MKNNQGYLTEKKMKKWFRGTSVSDDCVDFQTKTTLYEVKSCNLINQYSNSNHLRSYKNAPHKKYVGNHLGRFHIKRENHNLIQKIAKERGKVAKYIFVIVIGKQKIWKTCTWDHIDSLIKITNFDGVILKIADIFEVSLCHL